MTLDKIKKFGGNLERVLDLRNSRRAAYKGAFETDQGRKVLKDLKEFCGATQCSYNPSHDVHVAIFKEGRREVWLHVMKQLRLAEEDIYKLTKEEIENA